MNEAMKPAADDQPTSPVKAIRKYCLGCAGNSSNEVKLCSIEKCPLHPFRFGKNPYRKAAPMSEERKAALAEHLKTARENTRKNPISGQGYNYTPEDE